MIGNLTNLSSISKYYRRVPLSANKIHSLTQHRNYSIKIVNEYATAIIGKDFLKLSDQEKIDKLSVMACTEYEKYGVKGKIINDAEFNFQLYMASSPSKIGIKASRIMLGSLNSFWKKHEVLPPFIQGSIGCRFAEGVLHNSLGDNF